MKIIPLTVFLLFIGSQLASCPDNRSFYIAKSEPITITMSPSPSLWEREFNRWKNHLGRRESGNNWLAYNQQSRCMGKYQFQEATLERLGYQGITFERFISNPEIFPEKLQEGAFNALIRVNTRSLKQFEQYIGQTVDSVLITRSGLLAAAHLGGVGSIKSFFTHNKNPYNFTYFRYC